MLARVLNGTKPPRNGRLFLLVRTTKYIMLTPPQNKMITQASNKVVWLQLPEATKREMTRKQEQEERAILRALLGVSKLPKGTKI